MRHRVRSAVCTLVAGLASVALFGCDALDRLLSAEPRDRIPKSQIESSPANAQVLANGAVGDFECAFGAYVVMGGLIGEELEEPRQAIERVAYDQRTHTSKDRVYTASRCDSLGVYTPLQIARRSAENVLSLLSRWTDAQVPNRDTLIATMGAHAGYSTLLLGEGFCTTVLSSFDESGKPVYGGEISRDSAFRVAESRFGAAIAAAEGAGSAAAGILNLALVGRARARLDRGDYEGARSDAARVPAGFVHGMTASNTTVRRQNRVWVQNSAPSDLTSVGAPYRTLNDPRVPVTDAGRKSATGVPIVYQRKYASGTAPIPIASGDEAQLIIAEADIAAGTAASLLNAQTIINAFRARGNQTRLTTTDPAALRDALIDQRRRELFLEGQHLGDIIRLGLPLSPPAGARHPAGGTYGSQRCLLLPDVERQNNPALQG